LAEWSKAAVLPRSGGFAKNHYKYMPFVYILKSLKDGKYYYGSTENLKERIKAHNAGKVKSTKCRRPLVVHYIEELKSKKEVLQREIFFKSIKGYFWLKEEKII
jgi:putative endonuclease